MKKKDRKIHVLGLNSFKFNDLSINLQNLFRRINNIAVPEKFADKIKKWCEEIIVIDKNFYVSKSNINLIEWLKSLDNDVILISRGDPLWHGIGRILLDNFPQNELLFYPANTCIQLAFSKLKKSWQGTQIVSIHGRDTKNLIKLLKSKEKNIAVLTDPNNKSLELIRNNLKELGLEKIYEFWLLEEIGYEKENIRLISSEQKLPKNISDLNIVILCKKEITHNSSSLPLFGINDNYFKTFIDRPNLITKREIRIQLIADLELPEVGTLIDIGSGSGTIGIEAIRIRPKLNLISIDKRLGSRNLIKENAKRFNVVPKVIIEGNINDYLNKELKDNLSNSNRIIIGGCDKATKILVINELTRFLNKGDIIVLPIVTYEVLQEVKLTLNKLNYEASINLIQTFKGLTINEGTRFEPNNPVFIIKAKKK